MDIKGYISSGIIEMYVMGLCTLEEEKEFESLRKLYPELGAAVIEYENALETQMQKESILPSASVDEKILSSIDSLQKPVATTNLAPVYKIGWWKKAAAAVAILLVASSVFNFILYRKVKKQGDIIGNAANSPLPLRDYAILKDPAITPVAMYGVSPHTICRCTMFWDKKTGKVYIMIHHLPKSSSSKDYQLWAMVNDKPVSVGIINDEIRDRFIEMPNMPADAKSFLVTLENANGSIQPTMNEAYLKGSI
jgi:anti-sigma-K factor RskA